MVMHFLLTGTLHSCKQQPFQQENQEERCLRSGTITQIYYKNGSKDRGPFTHADGSHTVWFLFAEEDY